MEERQGVGTMMKMKVHNSQACVSTKRNHKMQECPINILKKRLATGEISIDEYNELSAVLAHDSQKAKTSSKAAPIQDKPVIIIDTKNWFGNVMFAHNGNIYYIEEIMALKSNQFTQTINFAPSHYSGFEVTLSNGSVLEYKAVSVIIRTKKVNNLSEAFDFISKTTFSQRVHQYLHQIQVQGFFQYRDYFIYDNGDIKYKTNTVNIAEAGLQNDVEFGRKSSFSLLSSYCTPDEIWVYQKIPGKFLKQHICIKTKENRDVVYAILLKLAELKGGKVTFVKH